MTVDASGTTAGLLLALARTDIDGVCTSTTIFFEPVEMPLLAMYSNGVRFVTGRLHVRTLLPEVIETITSGAFDPLSVDVRTRLVERDMETMPRSSQDEMRAADAHLVDALLAGSPARGDERRRLRAAAGHVVSYRTWRSLVLEQGLAAHEAVCLAARLLLAAPPACDGSSRPPD